MTERAAFLAIRFIDWLNDFKVSLAPYFWLALAEPVTASTSGKLMLAL